MAKGRPRIGPLTEAALHQQDGRPPDFIREFHSKVRHDGEYIMWWAGAFRRGESCGSWSNLTTHFGDPPDDPDGPVAQVMTVPAGHIERMLSPLAHEARIGILQQLYPRAATSGELTELTGLKGGNLHYHLKELMYGGYVEQEKGKYGLTNLGAQMLITMASIAEQNVKDRGDDGLQIAGGWDGK
ncbi:MAG TPA: winged helix-turn-helix domain-containing protein [Armatimonadota bacterium]|nr:winged helix-turn-helix domain-containing protein [Armatimonadota bacterium]